MLKPGPDLDFTMWLKETLGMSFSGGGVTPTVIGEFYLNFGYIGIYGGMFLLAKVGHWVNLYLVRHSFSFLGVYYLWQFAHCASGGIANITVPVTLYTIIYWGIMLFPSKVSNVSLRSNG